ncbi:MAG: HlyC/CorC family transporter [Alphaproteobacteria bacterium]|nr:HlyC/CorC family transporter [Alphaproteobacteria bacterium]
MDNSFWIELIGLFLLISCSGFFAGSETALTAVSRARLLTLETNGNSRARLVNKLMEKKDKLISSLLFGNTLVNIMASAFATSILIKIFGEPGVAYATIGVTALVLIFGEVLPKTYALINHDRLSLFVAPAVSVIVAIFSPITYGVARIVEGLFWIFNLKTHVNMEEHEEELRGAIQMFNKTMNVGEDQEKGAMLRSILDLADVKVEEVMVHRKDVHTINADLPIQQIIDEVLHITFTRLPVWKKTPDNIIGVIHIKLLLLEVRRCDGDFSKVILENAIMDPWFIPESTTLFDQLQAFRKRGEHFSIMVDEYGALMGVVTLEDILEEIVGEINDEHDTDVAVVRPQTNGSYIVEGKVTIRDLNRELDWGLPDEEYSTVAGLLLFESQRIPNIGQTYTFFNFNFKILRKQKNQISLVRITPLPKKPEDSTLRQTHKEEI